MLNAYKVVLIESFEDVNGYTAYIFKDLDKNEYYWLNRMPNWNTPYEPKKGDVGYVKFKEVEGGIDQWYDRQNNKFNIYLYDGVYFEGFILETGNEQIVL